MMNNHVDQPLSSHELAGVRQLLARAAIWECLMRYVRGVDRLDEDLVRSAFWPDAHDAHGAFNGSPDEFIEVMFPSQPDRVVAQHLLGSHSLKFTGEGTARSETYFVSVANNRGSEQLGLLGGRYDDEWERRGEEWRLSSRLVIMDWTATGDATGIEEQLSQWHNGSRDRNDPTYSSRVEKRTAL